MNDTNIRRAVIERLRGSGAHTPLEVALEGLPPEARGVRSPGLAHSAWEILEHLRITQEDILRYALDPDWASPAWPQGYWPNAAESPTEARWDASLAAFRSDLAEALALAGDANRDLSASIPHSGLLADGGKRSYLRQLLLIASHNSYHTGELVALRRALGNWPD